MRVCKRFAREALANRSELISRANSDKPSCTCLVCAPLGFQVGRWKPSCTRLVLLCWSLEELLEHNDKFKGASPTFFRGSGMGMEE